MKNGKKESISLSLSGWQIDAIDRIVEEKRKYTKTSDYNRSTFITEAICKALALEASENSEFWNDYIEGLYE